MSNESNTSGTPIIDCPECGAQFTSKEAFRTHARNEHGAGKTYRCSDCGARFDNADDLVPHAASCPKK